MQASTFLPSRLIYLDVSVSDEDNCVVKLCLTARLEQKETKYMTLSHRWGDPSQIFKLTCDNMDELTLGVPLSRLPPTFRGALEFALFCDVRYVWIDALCIKQDDRLDWSMEAPSMGLIYHNAFCNLSAAGLGDPANGLFTTRMPSQSAPIWVSPRPELWNGPDWKVVSEGEIYTCMPQDFFERDVELAPVNERAWVMQERLLSPRKIYFTDQQLFWECRKGKACEMFPNGIPEEPDDWTPPMFGLSYGCGRHDVFLRSVIDTAVRLRQMGHSGPLPNQEDRTRLLRAWKELLRQYISCEITYASDRLMAISGVTTYFEQALGDECVFGLWRSQLPFQLAFLYANEPKSTKQDPVEGNQKVPSWTWAYHERKVQAPPDTLDPENDKYMWADMGTSEALVTVMDITFDEKVLLPPTEVDGIWFEKQFPACLHLLCHLLPCMHAVDDDDNTGEDTSKNTNSEWGIKVVIFVGGMTTTARIKFDSEVPDNASIMPVYWWKPKMGRALVVSQVGGEGSRMFKRTGFLQVEPPFWSLFHDYWEVCGDEQESICLV